MKCYKAVAVIKNHREKNQRFLSWSHYLSGSLEYTIGQKTSRKPGHGPLAAFRTLAQTQAFVSLNGDPEFSSVLEGEGEKAPEKELWIDPDIPFTPPCGTLFLNSFTPAREIKS